MTALAEELLFEPQRRGPFSQDVLNKLDIDSFTVRIEPDRIDFVLGVRGRWEAFKGRVGTATFSIPRSAGSGLSELAARHVETFLAELAEDLQSPGSPSNYLDWAVAPELPIGARGSGNLAR